jgi:hypothetical protein
MKEMLASAIHELSLRGSRPMVRVSCVLSYFNFGLMGAVEARYNRIIILVDFMWVKLKDVFMELRIGSMQWPAADSKRSSRRRSYSRSEETRLVGGQGRDSITKSWNYWAIS